MVNKRKALPKASSNKKPRKSTKDSIADHIVYDHDTLIRQDLARDERINNKRKAHNTFLNHEGTDRALVERLSFGPKISARFRRNHDATCDVSSQTSGPLATNHHDCTRK